MNELSPISPSGDGQISANNRILIFSEDVESIILLRTLLKMWGYQTDECETLEEFLSIVKKRKPNLILLDSIVPFEDNLELIRQIRKNKVSKAVPIVALSGFAQPKHRSLSLAIGADSFFVKPIDFDALEKCLENSVKKQIKDMH